MRTNGRPNEWINKQIKKQIAIQGAGVNVRKNAWKQDTKQTTTTVGAVKQITLTHHRSTGWAWVMVLHSDSKGVSEQANEIVRRGGGKGLSRKRGEW